MKKLDDGLLAWKVQDETMHTYPNMALENTSWHATTSP